MLKRTLFLALLALAIAVPVASADTTTPPVTPAPAATSAPTRPQLGERIERLRQHIRRATGVFVKHCGKDASNADADKCKAAAQRMLARLQKLDGNIQAKIQTIQTKCSDATSAPKACAHADQVIAVLQKLDTKVQALAQRVQAWLDAQGSGSASTGSSSSDGSLEGLDQLATDLATL